MELVQFGPDVQVQLYPESKPFMQLVQETADHLKQRDIDDPFFLVDLGDVVKRLEEWKLCLPRVEPFYAFKASEDPALLRLLAHLGIGFDCASKKEICEILKIGVDPSRIVYAHPCKHSSYIRYAKDVNVDLMTFDNEEELRKIKGLFPSARLLLRITPSADFKVKYKLDAKFGCRPRDTLCLLRTARDLDLNVVGVSFHVGFGVEEPEVFSATVKAAAKVFEEAHTLGFTCDILDVGGGFPSSLEKFRQIAEVLRTSLDLYFPEEQQVRVLAEPGRYFVEAAFSSNVTIIAKRRASQREVKKEQSRVTDGIEDPQGIVDYYVTDGVFGSFNAVLTDNTHPPFEPRIVKPPKNAEKYVSNVWGPTCDSLDLIVRDVMLPELHIGDVISFANMGAYSLCIYSSFNGMPRPQMFYHCCDAVWKKLFPENLQTAVRKASSQGQV